MSVESTLTGVVVDQTNTLNNGESIETDPLAWSREFDALVADNASVIVECPWQSGLDMTLGAVTHEFLNNGYEKVNPENVMYFVGICQDLLNSAEAKRLAQDALKDDIEEQQDDADAAVDVNKDDSKKSAESNDVVADIKSTQSKNVDVIIVMPNSQSNSKVSQSNNTQVESRDDSQSSNDGDTTISQPVSTKTTAPKTPNSTGTNYIPAESSLNTIVPPTLPPKIEQTNIATEFTTQTKPETKTSEPSQVDIYPEIIIAHETEQTLTTLPEVMDLEVENNILTEDAFDDLLKFDEAPTEMPEAESTIEISDDQQANDITFGSMDKRETDKVIITQTEDAIIEISEQLENATAETTQMIHEILDEIIELPAKINSEAGADTISEPEAQEQLIELFTELFDELQIDYTPELLDSLGTITIQGHFTIEAEDLNDQEEIQNNATHTVVKQLYTALTNLKVEANQVCVIGKSALLHYGLSIAA